VTASGANPAGKAIETLAGDLEIQLKELNLGREAQNRLVAVTGVLRSAAAGRSVSADVKKLVDDVTAQIVKAQTEKDEDVARPLRQRREQLLKLQEELERAGGASGAKPATGDRPGRLSRPSSAGGYDVSAAWLRTGGDKGRVVARSDGAPDLPATPAGVDRSAGSFAGKLGSTAVTVFHAPAGAAGTAFLAMPTPASGGGGGGGSALGLVMLVLGPLLVGGLGWMLASAHGKPVRALARELDRLGSTGDPGRRIQAHGPEANAIARSVERMVANLKFRSQHEMSDLQEVIDKEQGMAAQIHLGLMPKNPPRIPAWEVETLFKPGFEIGGDHFDYFRIDDTHLGVIIMDTSVRGAAAAIVMSMARAYVHAVAPGVLSPAEVLMKVNGLLASDLSQGQYVTALYVVIDTESGTAKVASGGHLPLVVFRSKLGKTAIVNPEGIALGLDSGPVFDRSLTEVDVDIGAGDRLVLHTDGALKVQSEAGDEFGEKRLYETIQQKAPMNSQAFVNFVGGAIDAFHMNTAQNDDITISTVKRLK
ncbi:MAG TPA: SpoIIE family protein phosphatase, partial [Planctomycetota bacterium]|nr:SpoIIE family protein phosphatase [Planctomycetota bacterium]